MLSVKFLATTLICLFVLSAFSIRPDAGETQGANLKISTRTPSFTNVSVKAGLEGVKGDNLAWGDYNNDGYLDLLVRGLSSNLLFRNNGPPAWDFTDVSNSTGVNTTRGYCKWADYNGDGFLDFYSAFKDDHLFRNNGPPDWDFTDVTLEAGSPSDGVQSEGIGWGDYNRDGYPDIFIVGWRKDGNPSWPYMGERDRLYRNNGDGTFTDVSLAAGLNHRATSYAGMGVAWCDPNEDGWPDIYVCNYHINPNQLWMNNRDGTFTDRAFQYNLTGKATEYEGTTYYGHCNGAGWSDMDNDGDMDLFVSHLAHKDDERSGMNRGAFCADSQLFLNSGAPYLNFTDIRKEVGIPITPSGTIVQDPDTGDYMWKDEDYFGVAWGDMDNDGDTDLWVPQVKTYSFWDHSFLWENDGDLTFTDSTDTSNLKVWSNTGGTWVDYDNDGDLDMCTEGTYPFKGRRELHLFENPGTSGHWVEFDLRGAGGPDQTSTDAIGTRVVVVTDLGTITRYVGGDCGGHGFQQPQRLHFGLGSATTIDEVWVYWTSGRIVKMDDPGIDSIHTIEEPTDPAVRLSGPDHYDLVEDQNVNISVSISGASAAEYLWDVDGSGYGRETDTPEISITNSVSTRRWIRFRARDQYGTCWDLEPITMDVRNVPPSISPVKNVELVEGEKYRISTHPTDNVSDLPLLTFMWQEDDGEWVEGLSFLDIEYQELGEHLITVNVSDDDGDFMIKEIDVVVSNRLPDVSLDVTSPVEEDSISKLMATAVDSDLDIDGLQYRFHSGDGRHTGWMTSPGMEFRYTENGTFHATVEVKDRHDDISTASSPVRVINVAPSVELDDLGNELILEEDQEFVFSATGLDTDSDIDSLEYRWDTGDQRTSSIWTSSSSHSHTYRNTGRYEFTVSVRDDDGNSTEDSVSVIVENVPPLATVAGPPGDVVDEDAYFTLTAKLEDTPSDEDDLMHTWYLGGDNYTEWLGGDPRLTYSIPLSGVHRLKLIVRDDDETVEFPYDITVENVEPVAKLDLSSRTVSKDSTLTLDGMSSTDTHSDLPSLEYIWAIGKDEPFSGPSSVRHVFREGGTFNVELTVKDDDGAHDSDSLVVTVVDDPPEAYLEVPESVSIGETVTFDGSSSLDTPTDMSNLTYRFDPGDGTVPIFGTASSTDHVYTAPGNYEVLLTVSDGQGSSEARATVTVTENATSDPGEDDTFIIVSILVLLMVLLTVTGLGIFLVLKRRRTPQVSGPDLSARGPPEPPVFPGKPD